MNLSKLNRVWLSFGLLIISIDLSAQADTVQGHIQYLFSKFNSASLRMKNGSNQTVLMNYNMVSERMVFKQNNELLDLIKTETVDTVYLGDKKFIPFDKIFIEVVPESKIPLYFQHKGYLKMPGKPAAYGGTSETSSSSSISTLYDGNNIYNLKLPDDYKVRQTIISWVKVDGIMQKFFTGKQFLKIFKNKEAKLKQYIEENKINFNDQDDIVKLLIFCSRL